MIKKICCDRRGQSLVETALLLSTVIMVIFFMTAAGTYIYDKTVFLHAANKAADKGSSYMNGSRPTFDDDIQNNELTSSEKAVIREKALDKLKVSVFSSNHQVAVATSEDEDEITLKVTLTGTFDCIFPFVDAVFPQLKSECDYVYAK